MRIPASNKQTAIRRYSYRQRSDEIFLPETGGASTSTSMITLVPHASNTDADDDVPITAASNSPPWKESFANHSVVAALKKLPRTEAATSVTANAYGVDDNANPARPEDVLGRNQVENQENLYIAANQKEGNRAHCAGNESNANKLVNASSSSQQHKSGSLAERRLQQRSAIFKKSELENQPSVVNAVLKKRLVAVSGGGDDASMMMLNENHRVGPDKPIAMVEQKNPKGGASGEATDFATKLAWATKLEKRRDVFAKKTPSSPANHHHRRGKKHHSDSDNSNPEHSENKDTVTSNANEGKQDDRYENEEVNGGDVKVEDVSEKNALRGGNSVVEEVYPSPSHLDFSNTKAWAAELAKQKVLSDKKKILDINETNGAASGNMSSLDNTNNNCADNADEQEIATTTKTTISKDEKDEFSARLRAKRRQLSEKKRTTNDAVVASSDKAEDSVWYDFDIPTSEKHQSVSLSYSGTMDDQSVLHPVNSEDAMDTDENEIPSESNPLTPILLLQEKRILSLEKKRQSYTGITCEERENAPSTLVDLAKPTRQWTKEFPTGVGDEKASMSNENKEDEHSSSPIIHPEMEQTNQVYEASNKSFQVNQGDATSVLSKCHSEGYVENMEPFQVPRKSDLHLSLTSTQQIAFAKMMEEYQTKLECKSSEIEYLKTEISNQHVQILELLGQTKAARETETSSNEQRIEAKEKKSKMGFGLKRLSKMKLSLFH